MEVALRGVQGLGEYPGYYCYDANRPSWLPYWIDDFAEEECNLSPSNIASSIASCLNPLSADCSTPTNPNPLVSGPGTGGPALAAGNSTAGVDPIVSQDIGTNIGQAVGSTITGAASGLVTGAASALTLPLLILGGVFLLMAWKK
jgi:hypothetical protein